MFDLNFFKYSNDELNALIDRLQFRIRDLDIKIFDDYYKFPNNIETYRQIQCYLDAYIEVIGVELQDRKKRNCNDCKKWGSEKCPNSSECYSLDTKPYFLDKSRKTLINKLMIYFIKKKEKTLWKTIKEKLVNVLRFGNR